MRPELALLALPPAVAAGHLTGLTGWSGAAVVLAAYGWLERRRRRTAEERSESAQRRSEQIDLSYDELRSQQAELVSSARLDTVGRLVGGFAHEVNTPLGALKSNHDVVRRALDQLGEILEDERVDPSELEQVRKIVRAIDGVQQANDQAVERMSRIIETLGDFGRPDRAEVDRVDLHEGLDSTLTLLSHEIDDETEVVRDYADLPDVECRPHRLNQVFMNLLSNAAQAIDGEGAITVRTRALEEERVAVEISDTGEGIPAEHLERIFEPGFTTKGSRTGMGLGLLISRQIVHQHGGHIDVESTVGEGSTFTVTLHRRLPEGGRTEAAGASPDG